ncbi:MAG TPA: hypothetical protein VNF71_04560 [Acidimicrobiales bacterium]|nr:hypothetical protein [Acidimicrobiales bacterium]
MRTCDIGGWTDTWFGGPGRVLNVAVSPGIEVALTRAGASTGRAGNRLIEAALNEYPAGVALDVLVSSGAPAGSALGTSSAVAVALIGALLTLRGDEPAPELVARAAHRLESEVLGDECGVQDQLSAAFGGISYITVERYPDADVEPLPGWPELSDLLSTVFLGAPHVSSAVHREVIASGDRAALDRLRDAAEAAREAVLNRDLDALASAMRDNTRAQRELHSQTVGAAAGGVIDLARSAGAIGWKVNGAGGEGGSVAVLHASLPERLSFEEEVDKTGRWRVLPLRPCERGLEVTLAGS